MQRDQLRICSTGPPRGIFVDTNLDLYVADRYNHRVQLFRSGQLDAVTVAGRYISQCDHHFVEPHWSRARCGWLSLHCGSTPIIVSWGRGRTGFPMCGWLLWWLLVQHPHQLRYPHYLSSFDSDGNMFVTDSSIIIASNGSVYQQTRAVSTRFITFDPCPIFVCSTLCERWQNSTHFSRS